MRPRALEGFISVGLALLTVLVHLSVNTTITNDHAAYIALARQIGYGDWPIRDFRDDGSLLQLLLSAVVQRVGGFRLLGELLLPWSFLAAANCLTFWLAFRLSGSRVAAAIAVGLAVLLIPRPYAYPKLFIYPLAILVLWRYVERPQARRLAAAAAAVAVAFLFRIDHGVVIALTSVITVLAVRARDPRAAARDCGLLVGSSLLFGLPQLIYVTWSTGLPRYVRSILSFGTYAVVSRDPWPLSLTVSQGLFTEANAVVFLLNLFVLIAGAAVAYSATGLVRAWRLGIDPPPYTLWIIVVVVMWGLMVPMLARDQYHTRISEIGLPIAILGAWLAVQVLEVSAPHPVRWTVIGAVLATTVVALCLRTPMAEFFTSPAAVFRDAPFQAPRLEALATSPPIDRYAAAEIEGERWAVRYAYVCTRPDDRLLVTWFGPEVYLYAERAFAGDRWVYLPFDNSPERQRLVVEQIRAQSVPLVFVDTAEYSAFRAAWPALVDYLEQAYTVAADVTIPDTRPTRILARKGREPSRRISLANLPCFD